MSKKAVSTQFKDLNEYDSSFLAEDLNIFYEDDDNSYSKDKNYSKYKNNGNYKDNKPDKARKRRFKKEKSKLYFIE